MKPKSARRGAIPGVGFPSGVTLVPERPIGSPWLYSPNLTDLNAYICPGNSVVESLAIVNGSGNNNSPAYDGVLNWPSTIAAVQANCSGGIVLPGFFYNSSQDTCKNLGYGDSVAYTSKNYTGSNLSDFSQNFTYRQALLHVSATRFTSRATLAEFHSAMTQFKVCCTLYKAVSSLKCIGKEYLQALPQR